MSTPIIRGMNKTDLQNLLDLYKHFDNGDPELIIDEELIQLFESILADTSIYYFVAECDGILVASCNITIIKNLTRGARSYGLIENVITHKAYRNQGLGKKVIREALGIAKNHQCYKVMLLTGSKKEETLQFYRSLGFRDDLKTGFMMKLD